MARSKKNSAPATKAIPSEHLFAKVGGLARRCIGERRLNQAREMAQIVSSRFRLLRAVACGKYPALADIENDWPVTKMQMLLAHEALSMDLVKLRTRLERIMHQVDVPQVEAAEQNKAEQRMPRESV